MLNATIYCHSLYDSMLNKIKTVGYVPVGLGTNNFSSEWVRDNTLLNIADKNKYYAEYTFYYWYWKNILPKSKDNQWVGFCSYRELWGNKTQISKNSKFHEVVLTEIPKQWNNYDTIIGEPIYINELKLSKLLKRGLWSLLRNPSAIFKDKRTIRFQFDMWHGNGYLDKAIDLLDEKDREDFRLYTRNNVSFSRGNMFVCKSKEIMDSYFYSIFNWLEKCEKIFGFDLTGYGKTRMYAFLAERYLSYWFNKYTKPLLWPVIFFDTINEKN